jgi:hypothetical protein
VCVTIPTGEIKSKKNGTNLPDGILKRLVLEEEKAELAIL